MTLLALVGPTASGKTAISLEVAEAMGAEIVNIDSTLVFRGMDAWTGKPSLEARARVRHHLVDVIDPVGPFSVAIFQRLARDAVADIDSRGRRVLLVGGSGLYYRAVVDGLDFPATEPATRRLLEVEAAMVGPGPMHRRLAGLDPDAAGRIEPRNARRTVRALEVAAVTGRRFSSFGAAWTRFPAGAVRAAGLHVPRPILHARIERRAREGLPGLLAETGELLARGYGPFLTSAHVIGYAEAAACLGGKLSAEEAAARIARRDKELARRQLAWFRRDPRVRWFDVGEEADPGIAGELAAYFAQEPSTVVARAGREAT
jgi:tRNA dimethylallyltransferase